MDRSVDVDAMWAWVMGDVFQSFDRNNAVLYRENVQLAFEELGVGQEEVQEMKKKNPTLEGEMTLQQFSEVAEEKVRKSLASEDDVEVLQDSVMKDGLVGGIKHRVNLVFDTFSTKQQILGTEFVKAARVLHRDLVNEVSESTFKAVSAMDLNNFKMAIELLMWGMHVQKNESAALNFYKKETETPSADREGGCDIDELVDDEASADKEQQRRFFMSMYIDVVDVLSSKFKSDEGVERALRHALGLGDGPAFKKLFDYPTKIRASMRESSGSVTGSNSFTNEIEKVVNNLFGKVTASLCQRARSA
eukprot:3270882-Rhodomonas_salina.1